MQTLNGFDLLVTDIVLDDGDGLELATELHKAHGCAVVVLSGLERAPAALPPGVDLWLPKPIEVERFEKAVQGLWRARGAGGK
jgi:DNA-binding response OmpR family regulator